MRFVFTLLAAAGVMCAQPLPQLRIEAVDAGSVIYIRNVCAIPLTAFLVELVGYPGSSYSFWQDEVTSGGITPGIEKKYPVTNMLIGASPDYVKVQAAIYLDGGSSGIPAKVALLLARRRATLDTTRELIRRLEKEDASKATMTAGLKRWADSLKPAHGANRDAPEAIRKDAALVEVYSTIRSLDEHTVDETLRTLRETEKVIASSRPLLPDQ